MDLLLTIIAIAVAVIAVEPGTKLWIKLNNWVERKQIAIIHEKEKDK